MNRLSPLYPVLAITGTVSLAGVLLFYPLEIKAPLLRTAFLPIADERIDGSSIHATYAGVDTGVDPYGDATLVFTGDIMMARNVEAYIVANGREYPFAKVGSLLEGADLVIGNFEGTIREKQNIESTNVMSFDTTPENVDMLVAASFDLLSLSNNHADDFGAAVTDFTRETIAARGITPFGDAVDSGKYVARKTIGDTTFSFIGYHAFGETAASLIDTIQEEDALGNFVIMYPHWGPEYIVEPSSAQVSAAHTFVDAGADAVIGAHPHIIQTVEIYNGVPIIYSLGNFLFDQDWSEPTKTGLVAKMTVSDEEIRFDFTPIYLEKRQMSAASPEVTQKVLEDLGYPDGTLVIPRK